MTESQKQFLIKLLNEPSPSGYEEPVQKIWKNEVSKFCKNITQDSHGNLTAVLNAGNDKSILLVGHSDEIGLIVNYINDDGFVYVLSVGGIEAGILASHRIRIITKKGIVPGVIGKTSIHLQTEDDVKKPIKLHEVWIDIGAKNRKEAEKYISIGDPIIFGEDFTQLVEDKATARCWDNRVGVYVVAEVLRNLTKVKNLKKTVYSVSSIQEEAGVWGARGAAYSAKPTMAIAIDVTTATDNPGILKEKYGDTKVGNGPVITRGVRTSNTISDKLINIAVKKKIPYQIEVDNGNTGTDADPISQVRAGIPIGVVSLATRYLHSAVEILSLKDIDQTIELLTQFIIQDRLDI
jgi:putative aminopeptidase FrvX